MVRYDSAASAGSSSGSPSSSSSKSPQPLRHQQDIDGLLAGAGYKVRSSELRQVAQQLERLETAMPPSCPPKFIVDPVTNQTVVNNVWTTAEPHTPQMNQNISYNQQSLNNQLTVATAMEEYFGIRLVHMLMTCAESVQRGDLSLATSLIEDMQGLLMRVNTVCGIGKVAGHFINALSRRIIQRFGGGAGDCSINCGSSDENEILYRHFYEACSYLKFAHFTANQAILEAFDGHDCVHVVDFNLMHGLQWSALIQALALRPGGPPLLRLTGIGPPLPDGRDSLREIGLRLAELACSVNVCFAFRGVAASRLEDVKPWMLQVNPKEAVAVNSIMQLHSLLGSDSTRNYPIESVLSWIRSLNPKIMTVVEQEANHNQPDFLDRFTEALYYYSTMFDSLEAFTVQPEKALAEIYIQREIANVVSCEGSARVERHEPLAKWRARLSGAGFRPLHLGSNAFKQASMLLTLFSAEGDSVEENEGCLTLGWHSRPLITASAWQTVPDATAVAEFPAWDNHQSSS
ncbi:hypothetical protein PTKIN_Ptkin19aG0052100 [Pterospermum kingtungense]